MYETINTLEFSGAAFTSRTEFQIFEKDSNRICLIYGKNGTGKSTISKAFLKLAGSDIPEINYASLKNKTGSDIINSLTNTQNRIFVFNEDYIQQKVRLKSDGLGTIVLFGKQLELESLIENAETELEKAKKETEETAKEVELYRDCNSPKSPSYHMSKMLRTLMGDDNWAGRERLITGGRRNASVKESTIDNIMNQTPTQNSYVIVPEYSQKYALLSAARKGNARITETLNVPIDIADKEDIARALLSKVIEKPELNERERYLISILNRGEEQTLEKMRTVFLKKENSVCPFCLQAVSDDYKNSLVQSIEKVLSKAVEDHIADLNELKMESIIINFLPFSCLGKTIVEKCAYALSEVNETYNILNKFLEEKASNPYKTISLPELNIREKTKTLLDALDELENARREYNAQLDNIKKLEKTLQVLNSEIAYYEIEDSYNSYKTQKEEKETVEIKLEEKKRIEGIKKREYDDLQLQRSNIRIAIDMINARLKYVFYSNNRLQIEADDIGHTYRLKSNGTFVKPSDISVGERNILALCYFFVEILDKTDAEHEYSEESFVIIDDPISSFDHENRIGIMSLLRGDIEKIMTGNMNSKLLLMTHDLQSAFDLKIVFDEISDSCKTNPDFICDSKIFELKNHKLDGFKYKKRHEYTELLVAVYNFGLLGSDDDESTIGNIMRRTLEAFSTFVYKKGIDAVSTSDEVLKSFDNDGFAEYFKHLMYRLVLNGESHSEERVRSMMNDSDFFDYLSISEKQRTAKDIICFIYLLNKEHVRAHLQSAGVKNIDATIKSWCDEILSFVG